MQEQERLWEQIGLQTLQTRKLKGRKDTRPAKKRNQYLRHRKLRGREGSLYKGVESERKREGVGRREESKKGKVGGREG